MVEIALRLISWALTDNKSTSVQAMAWCRDKIVVGPSSFITMPSRYHSVFLLKLHPPPPRGYGQAVTSSWTLWIRDEAVAALHCKRHFDMHISAMIFLWFYSMFTGVCLRWPISINSIWREAEQVTNHYPNQWWPSLQTRICITRPRWIDISPSEGASLILRTTISELDV